MDFSNLEERILQHNNQIDRQMVEHFLKEQGLSLDKDVEYTVALFDGEKMIATGSFSGNVLKCIAVDKKYQGMAISNQIISNLINEEYHRGCNHLFIYTKPHNYNTFKELGFYKIAEVQSQVILLENQENGIENYLKELKKFAKRGNIVASIVVNCNPFTLGHQYLIEKAAKESDVLHVFVVWEDKSSFSNEVRYDLVKKGTAHLANVFVHMGKDYIISNATFPSYFLKEYENVVETHALLDLNLFGTHIKPALDINRRYIGEEPYCVVTGTYNRIMKNVLPQYGISVIEVPRLEKAGGAISASKVRELIRQDRLDEIKNLVPETTYEYIRSDEAMETIDRIKNLKKRH